MSVDLLPRGVSLRVELLFSMYVVLARLLAAITSIRPSHTGDWVFTPQKGQPRHDLGNEQRAQHSCFSSAAYLMRTFGLLAYRRGRLP